ncbi:MAG: sel1 repeat family protein [Gammaproteobacteria bacterium]|nr:sel1 repeat family protein [Gammaproteobacteria bacterium]
MKTRIALALSLIAMPAAQAAIEDDFNRCRAQIVRIGEDPRTPDETYCVGLSYQFAINRRRDSAKGVEWLRRAARQNHAPAQAVLGYMLEQGIGTARDPTEAFQWYQRAAQANNEDGLVNLGRAYENGIGTARDLARARSYYERAAAMGNRPAREALAGLGAGPSSQAPAQSDAQAEFARGSTLYKAGDYAGAARIFRALADRGYAPAQLQIGSQYARGEGLPRNSKLAVQWYLKSAAQGYAIAQNNLAGCYEYGDGVVDDWVESFRWAKRSADGGNPRGMFLVGRAYQFGIGVPQSRETAIQWFDRAASRGDDQADYWQRTLRGRGNFIGFRDEDEQNLVIGGQLRTDTALVFSEPRGVAFKRFADRLAYIRALRSRTDTNEAYSRWARAADHYAACKRGETGESYCSSPGPAP